MIISMEHGFTFFHNPKAGGTSVRATLEPFHDIDARTWGTDDTLSSGPVDVAHLGAEEFTTLRPDLWEQVRDHTFYCLCRDPVGRFYSSVNEHAKLHGDVDTRFAPPERRREVLFATLSRLKDMGTAEAVMDQYEFTHFRPQWIYWTLAQARQPVQAFPVQRINDLFKAIATQSGQPVSAQNRNKRERLNLPRPLANLAARRSIRTWLRSIPGGDTAKRLVRQKYAEKGSNKGDVDLSDNERAEIAAFVRSFYARDYALWPASAADALS